MRTGLIAFSLLTVAIVPAFAQKAPAAPKLVGTAAEIQAMVTEHKSAHPGTVVQNGPYQARLELRAPNDPPNIAIHPLADEYIYVVDGSIDLLVGGTLQNPKPPTNPDTQLGTGIEGGTVIHLVKGDSTIIPVGTPHQMTGLAGPLATDISMLLPEKTAAAK